jgi:hypothetical protein
MISTSKLRHTSIDREKHESILRFIQAEMRILMMNQLNMHAIERKAN